MSCVIDTPYIHYLSNDSPIFTIMSPNIPFRLIAESETLITELMVPAYANFGGKVHGGVLLSLMDKCAYVCATKHSRCYCVTVSVEGVEFLHPVEVGDLLTLKGSVNYVGNSTMVVGIRMETQNPRHGQLQHTNSSYFTMLARDDAGGKADVPGLIIENETQLRRFQEGKYLRQVSAERRRVMKSDFSQFTGEELKGMNASEKCTFAF